MDKRQIVLIEWLDSKFMGMWEHLYDLEPVEPCLCYSVGFLMEDRKDYKTIAIGISESQVLNRVAIPSGCIKSIKKLGELNE